MAKKCREYIGKGRDWRQGDELESFYRNSTETLFEPNSGNSSGKGDVKKVKLTRFSECLDVVSKGSEEVKIALGFLKEII